MVKIYSKQGDLLNIIYSSGDLADIGRTDITESDEFLQCAMVKAESGKVFKPHRHLDKTATIHIQEVFVILQGKAKIRIFDYDNCPVGDYPLKEGDMTVLLRGGHSLEIEEDCLFYEFKNGPYEGQEKDKIFIT